MSGDLEEVEAKLAQAVALREQLVEGQPMLVLNSKVRKELPGRVGGGGIDDVASMTWR